VRAAFAVGATALSLLPGALAPARAAEKVWIEWRAPEEGATLTSAVGYVEVKGAAGAGSSLAYDLVIVLDLSVSTRLPSGVDVDGDGRVGKSAPEIRDDYWGSAAPEKLCDDLDDTIAAAELAAARRLLAILDPAATRVGIVAFGDDGVLEAPVGSKRPELEAALRALDGKHGWYGGTNYAGALRAALKALANAPRDARERRRTITFLSDGFPTLPLPPKDRPPKEARAAAAEAAAAGVKIEVFALGPDAIRGEEILRDVATVTGGGLDLLERPGDVLFHLPVIELSDVRKLEIENLTAKQPARAVRLFPDGSFDGITPIVAGRNRLRVTATTASGASGSAEREVVFAATTREAGTVDLEVERLRQLLHDRTVEMQIVEEIRRKRREAAQRRQLEIRVEKP
jgi:hypothetical protein